MEPMLIARLALAAVFATAAIAKLRDLPVTRQAVADFGVPRVLVGTVGTLLPLAELAVAAGLAIDSTAAAGALAGYVMLLAFAVAIAWNLARGRTPDCNCFGRLHSSQSSLRTVGRNLVLAAVAGLVAAELADPAPVLVSAGVAVAILAPLSVAARRRSHAGSGAGASAEGPPIGSRAPGFRLPALQGLSVTLDALRDRAVPVLLIFSDANCGPCRALAPQIASWQRDHAAALTIAVIEAGTEDVARRGPDEHGRRDVLLQHGHEVADAYGADGTPSGVLIGVDGTVATSVAGGAAAIEALVGRVLQGGPAAARRARPIRRRELLEHGAFAWGAASAMLAGPAAALGKRRRRRACPGDQHPCGEVCCGPDQDCLGGRCRCTERRFPDKCGKECVDHRTDPVHCGGCYRPPPMEPAPRHRRGRRRARPGTPCESGEMCVNGRCTAGDGSFCEHTAGTVCCAGEETGLNFDDRNCGACGVQCTSGKSPRCCWGKCVDAFHDPNNCGRCGNRCHGDELCIKGECKRQRGCSRRDGKVCNYRGGGRSCYDKKTETCCEGRVSPRSDYASNETHCGGCVNDGGQDCTVFGDYGCCEGKCCDYNNQTCCPGGCKNLALDNANCGACGNACQPGEYCRFGICTCPPGAECA